jgi:cytochrome c oxidase subunit 4
VSDEVDEVDESTGAEGPIGHPGVVETLEHPIRALEERLPAGFTTPAPGLLPGEERPHPSPVQYVLIAVVLVVVTAVEVALSYMEGDVANWLIVSLLMIMAIVKFVLVVSWYMHLRTDRPIFRRFFVMGLVAAIVLYAIVLSSLHVFH